MKLKGQKNKKFLKCTKTNKGKSELLLLPIAYAALFPPASRMNEVNRDSE
jgi:hypothetical protein